jgi:hypothetical protein
MKTTALNLVKGVAGAIATLGLTVNPALADPYFSRPPEPSFNKPTGRWLITTSTDGIGFYALTPYTSAGTTDRNLYVNSAVMIKDSRFAETRLLQIDCGHLRYRDIRSGLAIDRRSGESVSITPKTYAWQRLKSGTALLKVGKTLCEKAASDRGLEWTWARY